MRQRLAWSSWTTAARASTRRAPENSPRGPRGPVVSRGGVVTLTPFWGCSGSDKWLVVSVVLLWDVTLSIEVGHRLQVGALGDILFALHSLSPGRISCLLNVYPWIIQGIVAASPPPNHSPTCRPNFGGPWNLPSPSLGTVGGVPRPISGWLRFYMLLWVRKQRRHSSRGPLPVLGATPLRGHKASGRPCAAALRQRASPRGSGLLVAREAAGHRVFVAGRQLNLKRPERKGGGCPDFAF